MFSRNNYSSTKSIAQSSIFRTITITITITVSVLLIFSIVVFAACTGDPGSDGPQGATGASGPEGEPGVTGSAGPHW
jgi:hypothetical protein